MGKGNQLGPYPPTRGVESSDDEYFRTNSRIDGDAALWAAAWALVKTRYSMEDVADVDVRHCSGRTTRLRVVFDATQAIASFVEGVGAALVQCATKAHEEAYHEEERSGDGTASDMSIELCFTPGDDGPACDVRVAFDKNHFDRAQTCRILRQLDYMVKQLTVAASDQAVGELEYASPLDVEEIECWNSTPPPVRSQALHELVEERARIQPDAAAISSADAKLSYAELNSLSTGLAGLLIGKGLTPGALVPIVSGKSAWVTVAMLAVLKAGGACVMVDASHPPHRIRSILEAARATVVLAAPGHEHGSDRPCQRTVALDQTLLALAAGRGEPRPPLPRVSPDGPAFVVFTSGSTGTPKGILLSHEAVATSATTQAAAMRIRADTRALQFASYAFDVSIYETFVPLAQGACVCVPSEQDRLGGVAAFSRAHGVTWATLTPLMAETMRPEDVPGLSALNLTGECPKKENVDVWAGRLELVNAYGSSEASTCAPALLPPGSEPNRIGKLVGARGWIVEPGDHNRLAPVGAPGELVVEGYAVASGYLDDEERTRAAFIEPPAWYDSAAAVGRRGSRPRLFKMADLVRYQSDGSMVYLGRKDGQIRLRGQRIDPADVETQIRQALPEVAAATVDVITRTGMGEAALLGAFISFDTAAFEVEHVPSTEESTARLLELRGRLEERLPSYMVPNAFIVLSSMPMLPTGKTDRRRLQHMAASMTDRDFASCTLRAPTGRAASLSLEQAAVREMWATVIGRSLDDVGPDDSFFRVGGDSISAIKLIAEARKVGHALEYADVFSSPSLSRMAEALGRPAADGGEEAYRPFSLLQPSDEASVSSVVKDMESESSARVVDAYPCTPLQAGLVALSLKESGTYLAHNVFSLGAGTDLQRFKQAWQQVVFRNGSLRTAFHVTRSHGLVQAVLDTEPEWMAANELDEFLEGDKQRGFRLGEVSSRFAAVSSGDGQRFFVWTAHHAIYDGWSTDVLLEMVSAAYRGSELPQSLPYSTFVRYVVGRQQAGASRRHWRHQLAGLEASAFPAGSNDDTDTADERWLRHEADAPAWGSSSGLTLSSVIQAAWAVVVARYTLSDDVVFGQMVAGRNVAVRGVEQMVGLVSTTVPMRVRVRVRDETARSLVERVQRDHALQAAHQHLGLPAIRRLSPDCDRACRFRNMLIVDPAPAPAPAPDDGRGTLDMRPVSLGEVSSRTYPLLVRCSPGGGKMALEARFDAAVVGAAQARRLLWQLEHVVGQMVRQLDVRVADVELASPQDRAQVAAWNSSGVVVRRERCVHDDMAHWAVARPRAPAVCGWDASFTHAELDGLAARLAAHLVERVPGCGAGALVAVCFAKSAWAVPAVVAVLKAGAGFVPLDPAHPTARLRDICAQADVQAALVAPSDADRFAGLAPRVIAVADDLVPRLPPPAPLPAASPDSVAYVVFTSGTTGAPKGVVIQHAALSSSVEWQGRMMRLGPGTRALQFASWAFDAVVLETVHVLVHGGCVCVPSPEDRLQVADAIDRMHVNWAALNPSVARALGPSRVPSLRTLVVGGEPVGPDVVDLWARRLSLINMYGPTETCVFCSGTPVDPHSPDAACNIGRCINSRAWVVDPDDHRRLAPLGAVGELVVEGPILAAGYLGDDARTASSFVLRPPWLGEDRAPSTKVYKTGDLVSYADDGTLRIVGRKDTQVKLRGNRIELSEIEHRVKTLRPQSRFVTVDLVGGTDDTPKQLAAFVCDADSLDSSASDDLLSADDQDEFESVRADLQAVVPEYMAPSLWIRLRALPITTSGKVDRWRLRSLASRVHNASVKHHRPNGRLASLNRSEQRMAQLWAEVLGVEAETLSADDNFFKCGGDSIAAMRLGAAAGRVGLPLTVRDVFRNPTMSSMAALTAASRSDGKPAPSAERQELVPPDILQFLGGDEAARLGLRSELFEAVWPCSPLQNALLVISQQVPGSYVAQLEFLRPENLDIVRFRVAWSNVARCHKILRTTYMAGPDGSFYQIVLKPEQLPEVDVRTNADDMPAPMGPGTPMARWAVTGDSLVFSIHHASYDGLTLPRILSDVERAYGGETPKPSADMSAFLAHLADQVNENGRNFWKAQLAESSHVPFPQLPSHPYQPRADSTLSQDMTFARSANGEITTATVIRAAWSLLVARHSDSQDIVFGMTVNGRGTWSLEAEDVMGPTIATMPVRMRIDPSETAAGFLGRVQDQAADLSSFEQFGMQNIRQACREAQSACEFQNLLAINKPMEDGPSGFLAPDRLRKLQTNFHTIALTVECDLTDTGASVTVYFDSRLLDRRQISRLVSQWECIVRQLGEGQTDRRVGDVDMISEADINELSQWNSADFVEADDCVHTLIQARRAEQGDEPAICAWDGQLSYSELDDVSTRLAQGLTDLVAPGDFVPVCFEKSMWAVVSMLAILKAGGAYVPLDPAYPRARAETIARAVKAGVVLCSPSCLTQVKGLAPAVLPIGAGVGIPAVPQPGARPRRLPVISPRGAAFVLFTSGSTGRPKGIVLEHRGFCYGAAHHGRFLHIDRGTRVFQFAAYIFDVSFSDMFATLIRGGTVCVPSEHDRLNDLAGAMTRLGATYAFLTPTVAGGLRPADVPGLRVLVLGGEAPTAVVIRAWAPAVNLIVVWGPAECTVYSTGHKRLQPDTHPARIGRGIGAHVWVTEPDEPARLAPVGSVGELVVEGPIVARGYINDPARTQAAFVIDPPWARRCRRPAGSRFYRTGDFGRLLSDGSVRFAGRRDAQVKIRGQRVELPEIEFQLLRAHTSVEHALALFPPEGPLRGQLVAVLTLRNVKAGGGGEELRAVPGSAALERTLSTLRACIAERVAVYMVPACWLAVERLPLMPSGKLNRAKVAEWVAHMTPDEAARIRSSSTSPSSASPRPPATLVERELHAVWCEVLNADPRGVGTDSPFTSLGGDSISAMQVVARCRARGLLVSVRDVVQSRTISRLAKCARKDEAVAAPVTDPTTQLVHFEDAPFELTPTQRMFFDAAGWEAPLRFNQSFLLRVNSGIPHERLHSSLKTVVSTHPMLRARFLWDSENETWVQKVTDGHRGSLEVSSLSGVLAMDELPALVAKYQSKIDIRQGPLMVAVQFAVADPKAEQSGLLLLICHHLVVDLVSWRVILDDLETLLTAPSPQTLAPPSTSFSLWNAARAEALSPCRNGTNGIPIADWSYWGIDPCHNTFLNSATLAFSLDEDATAALFGPANHPLSTEPIELMLTSLMHSFAHTFTDRPLPAFFNETHGRHSWDDHLDVSRTVGWFTSMHLICPFDWEKDNVIRNLRRVKDLLRATDEKDKLLVTQPQMEVLFNYGGRYQQLEKDEGLFESFAPPNMKLEELDVDALVRRLAAVEVSVFLEGTRLAFSFRFPRQPTRSQQIRRWVAACEQTLRGLVGELSRRTYEPTLAEWPHISTHDELDAVIREAIAAGAQVDLGSIEEAYRCTPVQEQMLRAHTENPRLYIVRSIWEINTNDGAPIDRARFENAWRRVVGLHSALRTRFVAVREGGKQHSLFALVDREPHANIRWLEADDEHQAVSTLERRPSIAVESCEAPRSWDVCVTPAGRTFALLQACHAIIDGISIAILHESLQKAYAPQPASDTTSSLAFAEYAALLRSSPKAESEQYWRQVFEGSSPCHLAACPAGGAEALAKRRHFALHDVDVSGATSAACAEYCDSHGIAPSILFQAAWALTLQRLTGGSQVCFGFVAANRDQPLDGIQAAVGPFIGFLPCRVDDDDLAGRSPGLPLASTLQDRVFESLQHRHLPKELLASPPFDTVVNYQGATMRERGSGNGLSLRFEQLAATDPMQWSLLVRVVRSDEATFRITLEYWQDIVLESTVKRAGELLRMLLLQIISS